MSEESQYGKLIVLTGAGASAALGLPTMKTFPRLFEGPGSVLNSLCGGMAWEEQGGDVEFIYDRLQLYIEVFKARECDANLQRVLHDEEYYSLSEEATTGLAELQTLMLRNWGRVDENNTPPGSLEAYGDFLVALTALADGPLSVFTTNYDLTYESLPQFPTESVQNGLRPPGYGLDRVWDASQYGNFDISLADLVIYRLHGCSHWFRDERRGSIVYQAFPTLVAGAVRPMVVWPSHGKTDAMLTDVFNVAYRALRQALARADVVAIVGYSFRDIGITEAVGSARPGTYFVVVDPELDKGYIRTKLDGRQFTQVKGCFGVPAVNNAALDACRMALAHEAQEQVVERDDFIPSPWEDEE